MTTAIASGRRLDWDSEFFGVPVGQGKAETPADVEAIDVWGEREHVRCLYLLVPAGRFGATQAAQARGFVLAGIRLTCVRLLDSELPREGRHAGIAIRAVRPDDVGVLEQIAAASHGDTRFYADPKFSRASCDQLYRTWIRRSCEGWADHVLVADVQGRPRGYVSLHLGAEREGVIGLLGVANDARRSGIGSGLLDSALRWFRDRNVVRASVATQAQNIPAFRLYQRIGFLPTEVDLWLHKWR